MPRPKKEKPFKRTVLELSKEQSDLLESARDIVRINGLPTANKDVILLALKFFVEEKTNKLKEQYPEVARNTF